MRLAAVHGVLLLLALAFAYQTWTRQEATDTEGSVTLWKGDPEQVTSVTYEYDGRRVLVERRRDDAGPYLWGVFTREAEPSPTQHTVGEQAAGGVTAGGASETAASAPGPAKVDTTLFQAGLEAERVFESVASLRALRDLGVVDDARKGEYGLADATARLVVNFRTRTRELVVGGSVYGSGDRYVLNPENGRTYVLSGELVRSLAGADVTLQERRLHAYEPDRVASVTLRTAKGERTRLRTGGERFGPSTWASPDSPDQPDQTFGNFMQRLEQLWISEFAPGLDPASLVSVVRADYLDAKGRPLGYLELFRKASSEGGVEYYLKTELLRVLAKTYEGLAEAVEQDAGQLF